MKKTVVMMMSVLVTFLVPHSSRAATIDVNGTAAMEGSFGLEVICDGVDTSGAYVQDDSPDQESTYRVSFLFNPAQMAITLTGSVLDSRHWIFTANGTSTNSGNVRALGVYLLRKSGEYWVAASGVNTTGGRSKPTPRISLGTYGDENSPHLIEVEWQASAVPGGNGVLRMRVDGGAWAERTDVRNYTQVINTARLGIVIGLDVDTVGSHFFDDFQSYRTLSP